MPLIQRLRNSFLNRFSWLVAVTMLAAGCGSTSTQSVTGPLAPKCTVSLAGPQGALAASGEQSAVAVTTTPECTWTATGDAAWITNVTPAQGQGSGQVQFQVTTNSNGTIRESTITVNGEKAPIRQEATACQFTVSAASEIFPAFGGAGSVAITAPGGCAWTASSSGSWVSLAQTAGSGSATVNFTVASNSGGTRSAQLTVAGSTVTVTQSSGLAGPPPSCTVTLQPTSASAAAAGGPGTVSVTANPGCSWTATSQASWITVAPPASGTGNGSVAYTVAANSSTSARTGNLTIGSASLTVNQAGTLQSCSYNINPTSQSVIASGQTGLNVSVSTTAGCPWTATSNDPWLTVTGGAGGSGNGSVTMNVAANTGAARAGTATIAGRTFTVNQAAAPPVCSYSINPTSVTVGDEAVTGLSTAVTAGAGCSWTATANVPWLTITAGGSGTGNGTVTFNVGSFGGGAASRTGTLTIGGQTFTVTQVRCSATLSPTSQAVGLLGGDFTVSVTTQLGCKWEVKSKPSWVTITSGNNGTGSGTVTYRVLANVGPARSDTLEIAEQNFTINQAGL
jgi:hypothetical protein